MSNRTIARTASGTRRRWARIPGVEVTEGSDAFASTEIIPTRFELDEVPG